MKKLLLLGILSTWISAQDSSLDKTFASMNKGDFKNALSYLEIVINNDSKNPELFQLKGMLYESLNDENNALQAWKECKRLSNNNSLILEANNHIQLLKQLK
ncbi:MAG: hypothetical protein HOK52_02330 [Candidatus Marinimicrobia bacterium]|jgi:tetratricopeptide (TPR) repeat protein|nr:hypothetical protein [Candidatus Neomarinimicrobiota bacterium]MBT3936420.1 hypothetical protein [Candidatus Neomarinimicrobiota bacterium]MBT3960373.1 hypothetical protein [Candidatus Neomarinimicrobiota bacterium]MBT4383461.1 hypothetical protein [Candidatus Neomarinimicrobiota bacterium]MBT4635473.1 hypothetical protein [Candidatus Neomarinimicrobiota bacterium]|tara:strand:+ start:240 stop:545 length:306 start_codon:yes stop_codon:yes gene_type:complete